MRLALLLLIGGAGFVAAVLNSGPGVALALVGGLLCASLGWLVYSWYVRK